jgi:hypothetical protein
MSEYQAYLADLQQLITLKSSLDAEIVQADAGRGTAESRAAQEYNDAISRITRLTTAVQSQLDRAQALLSEAGLAKVPDEDPQHMRDGRAAGHLDLNTAFIAQRAAVDRLANAVLASRSAPKSLLAPKTVRQHERRRRRRIAVLALSTALVVAICVCAFILYR